MSLIPLSLQMLIFAVVVAIVTYVVRRKLGWEWLTVVAFLGLSVLATVPYVVWAYRVSPLSPHEARTAAVSVAWIFGFVFLVISIMVAWVVAFFVPPRSAPEDAPFTAPPGALEDAHELLGLPGRYQALFTAYREARQQVVRPPWYRAMLTPYVPSYVRQDLGSALRFLLIPDSFGRDFLAAASVLTALGEMPTAQLSALEAYHRVNVKYVRRGLIPVRVIFGALPVVLGVAFKVLLSVTTHIAEWDNVWAWIRDEVAQPQRWGFIVVPGGLGIVLGLIAGSITVWWAIHHLEAFGDILSVALAHRRQESGTTQLVE
jgi:hypothetical protein